MKGLSRKKFHPSRQKLLAASHSTHPYPRYPSAVLNFEPQIEVRSSFSQQGVLPTP